MSRTRTSLVLACLVTPSLVACGGGGDAHIRGIDPAEARTLFPGSTRLDKTGAVVRSEVGKLLGEVVASSNEAFHMGDVFNTLGFPRVTSECHGDTCTLDFGRDRRLELTIEGLDLGGQQEDDISAVMAYRGVSIAHGGGELEFRLPDSVLDLDVYSYGGWMEYNVFAVRELAATTEALQGAGYHGWSSGIGSNTAPAASGGSAIWSGVMVGMDHEGDGQGNVIQGDAGVTVDFDSLEADVAFTNVHDLTAGTSREGNTWNDVPITGQGTFEGTNEHGRGSMEGRFYGPGHEEAGGVFGYDDITGAFGAKRDD